MKSADPQEIDTYLQTLGGLFVSSGGFTKGARREAGNRAVHIELVDLDRFLALWLQHYKISEAKQSKLRLEPVHFLAP